MIKWQWLSFQDLTTQMLYDILQLREAVFQIEQQSIYQDCDNIDQTAKHLLAYENKQLIAYLRIDKRDNTVTITRIVTAKSARGKGLGQQMLKECLDYIAKQYPNTEVEMSAQTYLQSFYNQFGFVSAGSPYDDAGVEHIRMVLQPPSHQ